MSTQIYVKCIDQTLTLVSTPLIASGGINEDVVNFTFCQKWEGFSKTAVFYRTPENVYYSLLDSDNVCVIPQEVLKNDGYLYFGVFGSNANGVTRTSEVIKYKVEKGAITENIKPSDPTPSIYEQILAKFQEIKEAETAFETNITNRQDAVEKKQTEFEKTITKQQNDYETDINKQWSAYKNNLTKQQTDYETDLSNQWTAYKTDLTNQQTEFEASTTEKLNTYEDNVESIAETSAKNAINTASQDKTVTLSTTWQYDSTNAYYTQSVAVVGMKATDKPILGIETSGNASDITSLRKEWAKVIQAETYDGGIKFYAKSATTKNLTVVIKPELSKVTVNNVSSAEAGLDELQEQVNANTNGIAKIKSGETKIPSWEVYKKEETPIGVWFDGKTIYRSILENVPAEFSVDGLNLIDVKVWEVQSNGNTVMVNYYYNSNDNASWFVRKSSKTFNIRFTMTGSTHWVILEYTKN